MGDYFRIREIFTETSSMSFYDCWACRFLYVVGFIHGVVEGYFKRLRSIRLW